MDNVAALEFGLDDSEGRSHLCQLSDKDTPTQCVCSKVEVHRDSAEIQRKLGLTFKDDDSRFIFKIVYL